MTTYTQKQLAREARIAVRADAKAAGLKARLVGWFLLIEGARVSLVAEGQLVGENRIFRVNVAI